MKAESYGMQKQTRQELEVTGATKGLHQGICGCGSSEFPVEHSLPWLLRLGFVYSRLAQRNV